MQRNRDGTEMYNMPGIPYRSAERASSATQHTCASMAICCHGFDHLVVDYYSNYFKMAQLANTKSSTVIQHIKSMFARHGIPNVLISDNGLFIFCLFIV